MAGGHKLKIKTKVEGLEALYKHMAGWKESHVRKVIRPAITKAGRLIAKTAKRLAPKETGLLRKSIASKVKTYKSGSVVAIIGPRIGFKREVTLKRVFRIINGRTVFFAKPKPEYLKMMRNPIPYAHLVEYGTSKTAAKPFMRPAWDQNKEQIKSLLQREIWNGIQKHLAAKSKKAA